MPTVLETAKQTAEAVCNKDIDCARNCSVSEAVLCDLRSRPAPKEIHLDKLYECNAKELIGTFLDERHYDPDKLVDYDCDVYVGGVKVVAFRKALFPKLKEGSKGAPETWEYFRWGAKSLLSDQRGLVAGKEMTTNLGVRLTNGQINFFKEAVAGKISSLEEARKVVSMGPDWGKLVIRVTNVKKDEIIDTKALEVVESELRKKKTPPERKEELQLQKDAILQTWFENWLTNVWATAEDKAKAAKEGKNRYVSSQQRANVCYSNILGAFDRGARNPYGRLSMPTLERYEEFEAHKDIYQTACVALKETLNTPENPRWDRLYERFSKVKDPRYNLFGTCFTTLTLNYNFRTAAHYDGNNCEGGIAVLTAMTNGEYEGHYLVFPEIRCAFDLRDGDFIAGDNQGLIHSNTAMIKKTPDAERVSLVFYSRERMTKLDSFECENCRKEFINYAPKNLTQHGKGHSTWNGVYQGMWTSQEWYDFRKERDMLHCSNSNYHCSMPYRNLATGEVKLYKDNPGQGFEHLQVWDSSAEDNTSEAE